VESVEDDAIEALPELVEGDDKDAELVLEVVCAANCVVVELVVAVGEGEGTGATEVVGAGATEVEEVDAGAGTDVSPQSHDMENRPTLVGAKN